MSVRIENSSYFPCTSLFSGAGPARRKRPVSGRTETGAAKTGCRRQDRAIRDRLAVSGFDEGAGMSGIFPGLLGPGGCQGSAWRCCQSNSNLSLLRARECHRLGASGNALECPERGPPRCSVATDRVDRSRSNLPRRVRRPCQPSPRLKSQWWSRRSLRGPPQHRSHMFRTRSR